VATATADPLVGRSLDGRYRILQRIARGGMSTVYAAVDERLDRLVAVKVMSSALSADPAFSDRFTREARAAARLTHVNAVSVYDQGTDESGSTTHVFLVMELVEGRTLRDLIRERGRFTPAETVSIMEPVLAALAAAHRAGIVHRDVKPENILLSDDGVVKVADFGLARAVESDAASTRTGLMMGTVAYCAPEQIARGLADQRSDVYSAGIVMFELLTGHPPYQGESAMNVAYQHVHSRVPAPSSRVRGIPNEVDELVVSATDSDPAGRPADAPTFLAEIADLRTTLRLPIVAIPHRPRPPAARPRPMGPMGPMGPANGRPARPVDAVSTDVFAGRVPVRGPNRQDTQIVHRPPPPRRGGPPPLVPRPAPPPGPPLPPSTGRAAQPPRHGKWSRRRRVITLVVILLIGLAAGIAGWAGTKWYHRWDSHVPSIKNQSLTDARTHLLDAHYKTGHITHVFSETVPKGDVISTDPSAGSRLEQGKRVSVVVSLGQDRVVVPTVAGKTISAAETALTDSGLVNFTPHQQTSTTVPKGKIIRSEPSAGTKVKRSRTVILIESSGLPSIQIPAISPGTPYDQAQNLLKQKNFKVVEVQKYNDTINSGDVISISPTGKRLEFSTVTVTVSKGPQFVDVPSIPSNSSFEDAQALLQQVGLVAVEHKVYGGHYDIVVDESPGAGASVRIGSSVVLTVF
jgi:serine/threonine-protein kinase